MEIIILEIYVIVCTLFLAGKDATSYLLKDKNNNDLTLSRISRWHRDGVALNALIVIPIVYLRPELYWIVLYALIIRLAFFDIAFNKWSTLDYKFLGSTAWTDKFFIKIFGINGAVKKSIFFFMLLVILNVFLK